MPPGRPRKPDQVHKLHGTFRSDRHGDAASKPKPSDKKPMMPADFKKNPEAKKCWNFVSRELKEMKLFSRTFQMKLELFCRTWSRYVQAEEIVNRTGLVLVTPKMDQDGEVMLDPLTDEVLWSMKRSPAAIESRNYLAELNKMLPELGLTPLSISKLQMPEEDSDPFSDLDEDDDKAIAGKVG